MFRSYCRKNIQYEPLGTNDNETQKMELERWRRSSIITKFLITCLVLGGCLFCIDYFELRSIAFRPFPSFNNFEEVHQLPNSLNGYLINTPGCRIPVMDPFDSSVKEFIVSPSDPICVNKIPPLFESNLTAIYMVTPHLSLYNVTNSTVLRCSYEEFSRLEPTESAADNQVVYSKKYIEISNNAVVPEGEFIQVLCKNEHDKKVYEDYFAFVPPKKEEAIGVSDKSKPNILIVGLDAVSRVNLHRQLPKTYKYLIKELGAIELLGYNKVADNTFPNLIPVFTGMFESELGKSCYPNAEAHFDPCPFLWKNYSDRNYVTAVGEDCAWIGLFNYQKRGFMKQTADYYYTTFSREMESKIGDNEDFNCKQCVGGRESYKVSLDYIKKFTTRMKRESTPYFAFFWGNSLSHDYLNRPSLGDQSYYELFRELSENGGLNNTILIFMSDHGIRWGAIRQTYQGQMEERLPFVILTLPKWFKENYPQAVMNLNKNVRRLTTPFDLHETLKDLLDVDNLKNARKIGNETVLRGYSLFNEIPKVRSCQDAEIVSHWCTCQQSMAIGTNDTEVVSAAKFAVNEMNLQLEGYAQCANLTLDNIINARVLTYDSEHITNKKAIKDYTITIKTVPGDGIFEVTVRSKETTGQKRMPGPWKHFSITGTVSRLNLYGKQSYCITDFHLKLYCFCKSLSGVLS